MKKHFAHRLAALSAAAVMLLGTGLTAAADGLSTVGGTVFDFKDQAFFSVKMYSEEKVYLDLDTSYQKDVARECPVEIDRFYNFQGENDTFYRSGWLLLEAEEGQLLYEVEEDGSLTKLDAEYVEDYATTRSGEKVIGLLLKTKSLGNYAVLEEEL